jgi:signal transduction histidine kinase
MRYPAFVEEIASDDLRPKIRTGIFTGYATAVPLLVLSVIAQSFGAVPDGPWPYVLIGIKVATNTAAWWAGRTRRLYIELSALNIVADVLLMTGAVYFTGGVMSPFVSLYFVEIAVMALLTNTGLTITTTAGAFLFYAGMVLAVQAGLLPQTPTFFGAIPTPPTATVLLLLAFVAAVLLVPATYIALIVERLRDSERALGLRAAELTEASKAKSEFTTNVTHELRTPLHGILGMKEALEEEVYGPVSEGQREALDAIGVSARGLLELIDSLLVMARADALRLDVRAAPIDAREVITSVVATARMLVSHDRLSIEARMADGLPAVRTDRQKLVQILVNLLANAVKFTPDDGSVVVTAEPEDGGVAIRVTDTGCGIPADALPTIFEPYVQADGSPRREHGGAGIGLAIVKQLIEAAGGRVGAESRDGLTRFWFSLPA